MNITINRCKLPVLRKNIIYKVSLGNLFLDNFLLEKNYNFPSNKKIIQSHLIGKLGHLVFIHNKKVVIEGYFNVSENSTSDIKFYNLKDQNKLRGIFPKIDEKSFNFTHHNLFFHE